MTWTSVRTDTHDSRALCILGGNDGARLLVNITDPNITEYTVHPVFNCLMNIKLCKYCSVTAIVT